MRIESLRVKNFKAFCDVHLTDIPAMLVVVGANGTGKSTLFDVFSFLRDCLTYDVRKALNRRGGFREVLSREAEENTMQFEVTCRLQENAKSPLIVYHLKLGDPATNRLILLEKLQRLEADGSEGGDLFRFAQAERKFTAVDAASKPFADRLNGELSSDDVLSLQVLRVFRGYSESNEVYQLLTSFHLFHFDLNAAIGRKPRTGDPEQLSESGDNLALVARTLYEQHPDVFAKILTRLARHVPGLTGVEPLVMEDGSLILRFQDGSFKAPFLDRQMSDGTIKLFAYLVLL